VAVAWGKWREKAHAKGLPLQRPSSSACPSTSPPCKFIGTSLC
jgi:hypothetical protein